MDYRIDCYSDESPSQLLVHQVLYVLVSCGSKYNVGNYPGHYGIATKTPNEDHFHHEDKEDGEIVEKLPEIIEIFDSYNLETTTLSIGLADTYTDSIHYSISFMPKDHDKTHITILSNKRDAGERGQFLRLMELVETVCRRFGIYHAAFRWEDYSSPPVEPEDIVSDELQRVAYYSNDIVEMIGREHLLSTPAYRITEHEDGGVFLIIDPEFGFSEQLETAQEHLSD